MSHAENKVLADDYRSSNNFFESDRILRSYLEKYLPENALQYMQRSLLQLGEKAANTMDELSRQADRHPPQLNKRSKFGEDIDEVVFHPAYGELMGIAAESEMFFVKYHPDKKEAFTDVRHQLGFAAGQLYGMSELGQYCPHCMTDGAAYLIERFASDEEHQRLLPQLGAREAAKLYSGAMFLTEKSGGSDVGANMCRASQIEDDLYRLNGEKWFCSNVNADVMMVLARTGAVEEGTRGLSIFLVEKYLPDGSRNPMEIIRLKDKLGVRSMATGEVKFNDTIGRRLGEEGEGFKVMAEMINISRNYNSVAALAASRRAMVEAWQYLNHRITFGERAITHALIREKFYELGSRYLADFLLVWRGLRAMDAAEEGNEEEQHLARILTPMAKWRSAEQAVYTVRECMELMGGNGYIEDFVMPKLLRDVNVLPIWEGSGNIIVLDILRAARKSRGLSLVFEKIAEAAEESERYGEIIHKSLAEVREIWNSVKDSNDRQQAEATAKPLFKQLITLFQMALLIREEKTDTSDRFEIALGYLAGTLDDSLQIRNPLKLEEITELIGWDY